MRCVLDSSCALAWVLPGEANAASAVLLSDIAEQGAVAPGIWPLDVANVLRMAEKRGRIPLRERVSIPG